MKGMLIENIEVGWHKNALKPKQPQDLELPIEMIHQSSSKAQTQRALLLPGSVSEKAAALWDGALKPPSSSEQTFYQIPKFSARRSASKTPTARSHRGHGCH